MENWQIVLSNAQKVHGSWRKFPQTHGKLMEIYIRSNGCTESWQRLTEDFRQISVCARDYLSIFRTSAGSSFNYRQLAVCPRDLTLTFYASVWTSVKYSCGSRIFIKICQLYVRQRDNPSPLHSSVRPSINFYQLLSFRGEHFVWKLDLPCDLLSTFRASPVPSIKF